MAERSSTLLMIGNFDGVHRGHTRLLERGIREAQAAKLRPVVLTFHPHPAQVVGRGERRVLTPLDRKVELLARLSPELVVVVEPFTEALSQLTPEQFASRLVAEQLGAARVIVGENFRFGQGRRGHAETLKQLGALCGFEADTEPLGQEGDEVISSTRIRCCLERGQVAEAERLLGRPHCLEGDVVRGGGQARQLGVPSANLGGVVELMPGRAVYGVRVDVHSGGRFERLGVGIANVGVRPTLSRGELRAEVHVLELDQDLYGRRLRAHLVFRLRDEQRFDDVQSLRAQLAEDKRLAARRLEDGSGKLPKGPGPAWY